MGNRYKNNISVCSKEKWYLIFAPNGRFIYRWSHIHVHTYIHWQLVFFSATSFHPVVTCELLSAPSNGQLSLPLLVFDSVATYTCNEGYQLTGNMKRTCLDTGLWSGFEPACSSESASSHITHRSWNSLWCKILRCKIRMVHVCDSIPL